MSTILTAEAAEGYAAPCDARCPYLNTSPASMAWHLGRELARWGEPRPTPDEPIRSEKRVAVTMGRGDTLNLRGRCDVLLRRFKWKPGNTFTPLMS